MHYFELKYYGVVGQLDKQRTCLKEHTNNMRKQSLTTRQG